MIAMHCLATHATWSLEDAASMPVILVYAVKTQLHYKFTSAGFASSMSVHQVMCGTLSASANVTLAKLASPASNPPYDGSGEHLLITSTLQIGN